MIRTFSYLATILLLVGSIVVQVNAQTENKASADFLEFENVNVPSEKVEPFRYYKKVSFTESGSITVPTVVEVGVNRRLLRHDAVAFDTTTKEFIPALYVTETRSQRTAVTMTAQVDQGTDEALYDQNMNTKAQFNIEPSATRQTARIAIESVEPVTSSEIELVLADHVALPRTVEVRAEVNGENQIVVAERSLTSQTIKFPETTASNWEVFFTYAQPLVISELQLIQSNIERTTDRGIRFLAQPDHSYILFFGADRTPDIQTDEMPNLRDDEDVLYLSNLETVSPTNPYYKESDRDNDGVPDITDNCVSVANPDQEDVNRNGRGDACDDFDRDGQINNIDNCPNEPNRSQRDTDGDGIGDACDDEESRFTEKYPWLPWVAMGIAALVLISLTLITLRSTRDDEDSTENNDQRDQEQKDSPEEIQ